MSVVNRWLALAVGTCAFLATPQAGEAQGTIRGTLVDSLRTGGPVVGAEVVLMGASRKVMTERGGEFVFADVPEGQYTIAYWAPWLDSLGLPAIQRQVRVRDGLTESVILSTPSSATIQRAACGEVLGAEQGILIGDLRGADGAPATGVGVYARWLEIVVQGTQVASGTMAAVDTTNASGSYVLCGVPVGAEFSLRALGADGVASGEVVMKSASTLNRRDLIVGASGAQTRLTGRIVTESGNAIANATVLVAGDSAAPVRTDADGRFELSAVPRRTGQLVVRALGYTPLLSVVDPYDAEVPLDDITMEKLSAELEAMTITGTMSESQAQFEVRKARGLGYFIDDAAIKGLGSPNATNIAAMVPRAAAQQTRAGPMLMMRRGSGFCRPRFFIDGYEAKGIGADEENAYLSMAKRVEMYTANSAPPQYNDFDGCGAVVIWTR